MSVDQLVKELTKHLSVPTLDFVSSQLQHSSPQKLLAKVFPLPSVKTLQGSVTKLKIYPGFNKALLDTFKIKVNVMADQLKLCCVI